MSIFKYMESNVRGYCRDYPCVFESAKGAELTDEDGNVYIDFLAGAGTLNYGHNEAQIQAAVQEYLTRDGVLHGLDMHTEAKARFLETFQSHILEPRDLNYKLQFTGPTGTNAVEAAMKLARKVTGRHTIVSFTNAFHGMTLGSLAATATDNHRAGAGVPLTGAVAMPYDRYVGDTRHSLDIMEKYLTDSYSGLDKPAAIILETVQGEGGINVASRDWLRGIQALCQEHGILLIVDDIQMGCGRTGSFFSFERSEIEPDLVTLSKSLSGIGLPLSLLLIKPKWDQWKPGEHNGTFRGNNLAFVSATKMIELYWKDDRFSREVYRKSEIVRDAMREMRNEHRHLIPVLRGCGMVWGLQLIEGAAAIVVAEAFKRKLIIETCGAGGSAVKFLSPLTIDVDLLREGLSRLSDSVAAVADQVESGELKGASR